MVNKSKWHICDKYGWPVERIKGRPITNFIRLLIHGRSLKKDLCQRSDDPHDGPTCWKPDEPNG